MRPKSSKHNFATAVGISMVKQMSTLLQRDYVGITNRERSFSSVESKLRTDNSDAIEIFCSFLTATVLSRDCDLKFFIETD